MKKKNKSFCVLVLSLLLPACCINKNSYIHFIILYSKINIFKSYCVLYRIKHKLYILYNIHLISFYMKVHKKENKTKGSVDIGLIKKKSK